jgi:hypothetical protein
MNANRLSTLALLGLALGSLQAQSTPFTAKQRIVQDEIDSSGKIIRHRETLGAYFRNSAGSTVSQTYSRLNGKSQLESGRLFDYDRRTFYAVDYQRHTLTKLGELPDHPPREHVLSPSDGLGEETINGIQCVIKPIFQVIDGHRKEIGRVWTSIEHNIAVRQDAVLEPVAGPRTHQIIELYDISFVDPNPNEFAIEEEFSTLHK